MGGNALKNTFTRRYQKDEFEALLPELQSKLLLFFKDAQPTKYYATKESFGDADFLCLIDNPEHEDVMSFLKNTFAPNEIFKNGNVYSFDYKELQVDLILTPQEDWETSLVYFSYNDLHNLIGKSAHKFGLKWGHQGLKFVYRIDGKVLGEIIITKDHKDALNFLGFTNVVYEEGFKTLDDIFNFVTNSKYFNPYMYDLENMNKMNRDRDKKRKTYQQFLELIQPMKDEKNNWYYFYPDKKVYLGLIDHFFPGFLLDYTLLEKAEEQRKQIAKLFNGNILMKKFGLSGPNLGAAINRFQSTFISKLEMNDWILTVNDTEKILERFEKILILK